MQGISCEALSQLIVDHSRKRWDLNNGAVVKIDDLEMNVLDGPDGEFFVVATVFFVILSDSKDGGETAKDRLFLDISSTAEIHAKWVSD